MMHAPTKELDSAQNTDTDVKTSAIDSLWARVRTGAEPPPELAGRLDLRSGYRCQLALRERWLAAGERAGGWKIGATAPAMRTRFGTDAPLFGYLLAERCMENGIELSTEKILRPALESELCFRLGRPLRGPGVDEDQVAAAVAGVAAAFEIVSLRVNIGADLGLAVADNVAQWAYVRGTVLQPYPAGLALGDIRLKLSCNEQLEIEALGHEVIDHQLASIAWLANTLAEYGCSLEAEEWILSGSFHAPQPLKAGQHWRAEFSGIGHVDLRMF